LFHYTGTPNKLTSGRDLPTGGVVRGTGAYFLRAAGAAAGNLADRQLRALHWSRRIGRDVRARPDAHSIVERGLTLLQGRLAIEQHHNGERWPGFLPLGPQTVIRRSVLPIRTHEDIIRVRQAISILKRESSGAQAKPTVRHAAQA